MKEWTYADDSLIDDNDCYMFRTIQLQQIAWTPLKVQNREKIVDVNFLFCYSSYIWVLIEINDLSHASYNINI